VDTRVSDTPQGRFPKSTHLLKHSDFQRVYQQGHRHFSGNMTVFYLLWGPQQACSWLDGAAAGEMPSEAQSVRVGFTVPRSLGGAVERNRMRRRTREAVRHNLNLLNGMSAGVDVVINPKKGLLEAEFAQISREIERAFQVVRRACESGAKQSGAARSSAKKSGATKSGVKSSTANKPATNTKREAPPQ